MNLVLKGFGHYFSIEGRRGGLSSTVWHFLPAPGMDGEEAKAGMEAALGFHAGMIGSSVLSAEESFSMPLDVGRMWP